ncbi:MAG: hypothetical protein NC348_10970, partial [Clostridium sp.]|nr:hypothetical protein [Clostridium sp.]
FKTSTPNNATDEATKRIHDYTEKVKIQPEVRDAYMKYDDIIYYERKDAALNTKIQDICELLEDYGTIPDALLDRLHRESDLNVLAKWHKLAARADNIEEFSRAING